MKALQNLFILVAEDDADDAAIIKRSFEKHAAFAKVLVVENGKELWDFLKLWDAQKPDIILSDINMPVLSGIEVLEKIAGDVNLCAIPFFMYSSSGNMVYEKKCRDLGAKGFLVKPFNLAEFDEIPYQVIYRLKKDQRDQSGNDTDDV